MNIAQAFFTALLSGLFSGVTLFFLNDRRERTSRRLSKLEEAAEAYFRLGEATAEYIQSAFDLATRRLTQSQWNDDNQPKHDEAVSCLVRSETLLSIYAPDLIHVLSYIREPWVTGLNVVTELRMAALTPEPIDQALYGRLSPSSIEIINGRKRGMGEITSYCQQLANQPIRRANIRSTPRSTV